MVPMYISAMLHSCGKFPEWNVPGMRVYTTGYRPGTGTRAIARERAGTRVIAYTSAKNRARKSRILP